MLSSSISRQEPETLMNTCRIPSTSMSRKHFITCRWRDVTYMYLLILWTWIWTGKSSILLTIWAWVPAEFFPGVGKFIGVARIFYGGVHFVPQKVDNLFIVVALKSQAKTTKWTTPTLEIFPVQQKWGADEKLGKPILHNWSTERLTVTANAQNILQHFHGGQVPPPLPMPAGAYGSEEKEAEWSCWNDYVVSF